MRLDCIEAGDAAHLREELGDVLMQVMLHAQIAADEGAFTIADVVGELNEKLVRRHPHVFGARGGRAKRGRGARHLGPGEARGDRGGRHRRGRGCNGRVRGCWCGRGRVWCRGRVGGRRRLAPASPGQRKARRAARRCARPRVRSACSTACPRPFRRSCRRRRFQAGAKAGFEWETVEDVWAQAASERAEFEAEEPVATRASWSLATCSLRL